MNTDVSFICVHPRSSVAIFLDSARRGIRWIWSAWWLPEALQIVEEFDHPGLQRIFSADNQQAIAGDQLFQDL